MEETVIGGRYLLRELIAEGGSSSVYRAEDPVLAVDRAVKVLGRGPARNAGIRERFLREGRLLARLRHPNLVTVHDQGEWNGRPFLVMDLLTGGSLEAWVVREGPPDVPACLAAVEGVLEALVVVHAEGVVHRDVKPGNVLVDGRGQTCLTDFGIARILDGPAHPTATGSRLGTFAYMAPEQLADPRAVDGRADVYAVGALLFAILLHDAPFGLTDPDRRDTVLARLPPGPRAIVARATWSRPEARYASAEEMLEDVRRHRRERPVARSRAPAWVAAGAALGAAVAVASGRLVSPGYAEPPPAVTSTTAPAPAPTPVPAVVAPSPRLETAPVTTVAVPSEPTPAVSPPAKTLGLATTSRRSSPSRPEAPPTAAPATPPSTTTATEAGGWININSVPWSEVTLDGRPRGRTPLTRIAVPTGAHTIRLVSSVDGGTAERSVTVSEGATVLYCWDYREGADCKR